MSIVPWIFRIAVAVLLLLAAGAMRLTVIGVDVGLMRRWATRLSVVCG